MSVKSKLTMDNGVTKEQFVLSGIRKDLGIEVAKICDRLDKAILDLGIDDRGEVL